MSQDKPETKTLRDELNALFGIRWDTLVEWSIICWLGLWFWVLGLARFPDWTEGPFTSIETFLSLIGIPDPGWLSALITWIIAPEHAWMAQPLIAVSVVCCVSALRSYSFSGLRTLALIAAAVACEMQSSFLPVVQIVLLSTIPAIAAIGMAVLQKFGRSNLDRSRSYYIGHIIEMFITRIVLLFLAPALVPILLLIQLVTSFRTVPHYSPVHDLNETVITRLRQRIYSKDDRENMVLQLAATAAIQLADSTSTDAKLIARRYTSLIDSAVPTGARAIRLGPKQRN